MPLFAFQGRNARGELLRGVLEGADSGVIADQLSGNGVTPITIVPTSRSVAPQGWWARLTERKVSDLDVQLFSRQIYTLIKSGVPLMRGLAGLQESAISSSFGRIIADLRESLDAGRELSVAMGRHPDVFSSFYCSMVRVGEMTGRLEEVFLSLFDHLEFDRSMRERVRTALLYPSFVVTAMVVAIGIVNIFVIPQFSKVFAGFHRELPWLTRMLIAASSFMADYALLLLLLFAGAVLALRAALATPAVRLVWDRCKLRLPLAGKIIIKGTMARFARSFALAQRSGLPIVSALTLVGQTVDNAHLTARIDRMRDVVERGESITRAAVVAAVFTPLVLQMIAVGEESGTLDNLMEEIAKMYEREVDYELKTLSSQIEPILIVFLGVMVLLLALGIFLPIWDLGRMALPR